MRNLRKAWLRLLAGGCAGLAVCLLLGYVLSPGLLFGGSFQGFSFYFGPLRPEQPYAVLSLLLWFLFGAEAAAATLPFAGQGVKLLLQSLAHFAVMAATLSGWVVLNLRAVELPVFLVPFAVVYLLIWSVRWVVWYFELSAIRAKLGLKKGGRTRHE